MQTWKPIFECTRLFNIFLKPFFGNLFFGVMFTYACKASLDLKQTAVCKIVLLIAFNS